MDKRKPTEKEIEISILKYLQTRGYWIRKNYDQAKVVRGSYQKDPWAAKGMADLIVMVKGRIIFLEVKTEVGSQSVDQVKFQFDCEAFGIPYFVVRSAKDALAVVKSIESSKKRS